MEINYEDFRKVDIRVGTVLSVKNNEKARQPALVLEVEDSAYLLRRKKGTEIPRLKAKNIVQWKKTDNKKKK